MSKGLTGSSLAGTKDGAMIDIFEGCRGSRCLTTLVPQPLPRPTDACQIPWSGGFDRIFRNEEVAGSNPASSTDFALH